MAGEDDRAWKKRRPRGASPDEEVEPKPSSSGLPSSSCRPSTMPASPHPRAAFNATLQQAVFPHVRSFDSFLEVYLQEMVKDLPVVYVDPSYDPDKHEANPYYSPTDCESSLLSPSSVYSTVL
ncbi:DNA-directed RNA polymerase I RPA2 [Toxoplasma gondii RUB]|uniref:DNA-directed RNA polymerase I RPA2 n=3 Tax=Toxoplasma gondii TaxID=5811 RepID=A0A2G8XVK0_TOXGO|nr:DNA-directed RNA polymerase I RPA2 [Toxoplasma gondii RUB]PIL99049.1 DNA-directed RNA polymerase I RPA2 [Toxoplasma gondii COUG]RQX67417.1 DNA-directed RNA polymerase I RPA2 [Toxoplasma gondii CAST]